MNELKVFTADQANQLLPHLTELLHSLQAKRDQVHEMEVGIDALELIAEEPTDDPSGEISNLVRTHQQMVSDFYEMVEEIQSNGCFLKDVDMGLIDLYGVVEGRVVYFCWKLGEERVGYWHEIGKGYAFREPL